MTRVLFLLRRELFIIIFKSWILKYLKMLMLFILLFLFIDSNISFLSKNKISNHQHLIKSNRKDIFFRNPSNKLDFNECFYIVLEVSPDVDPKLLKKAYYKLVFKYHPDNCKSESEEAKLLCNQQMMVINNAYRVLRDPNLRSYYDHQIKRGLSGNQVKFPKDLKPTDKTKAKTNPKENENNYESSKDYTNNEEVDAMGWKIKDEKKEKNNQNINFNDIMNEQIFKEEWFDEDLKKKLIRQLKDRPEDSPINSLYDEIKALLKNEDTSRPKPRVNYDGDYRSEPRSVNYDEDVYPNQYKNALYNLKRELLHKENIINSDRRDWGEVKDPILIEKRLCLIQEIKELRSQIENLEDQYQVNKRDDRMNNKYANDYFESSNDMNEYIDDYEENLWRSTTRRYRSRQEQNERGRANRSGDDIVTDEIRRLRDI